MEKEAVNRVTARAIFSLLLAVLFTASVSAQQASPPLSSADGRFVLTRGGDNLQSDALTKLTAEEVRIIIESQAENNPRALALLAADPAQRKKVLENLKQALAVAAEARRTGFTADEGVKMQLALARIEILAVAYDNNLKAKAGTSPSPDAVQPPLGYIADKDVAAFFESPANKAKYAPEEEKFLNFLKREQTKVGPAGQLDEEQLQYAVTAWKKAVYGAAKALELRLGDKKVELLVKLQQSLILARNFSQEKLKDQLSPTADEIKAYMAANARFNKLPMRARADEILAKVNAGGDFAALANEFSEDPGNKDETGKGLGGLYDWRDRDIYVKEFSDAAWALKAGETSGIVETQFGYHIIKLEDKRVQKGDRGDNEEQIKVRHILISTMYKEEPDPASTAANARAERQPIPMEEGAKEELAVQKESKVLEGIVSRNPISLPVDFSVNAPGETTGKETGVKAAVTKKAPVKAKSAKKGKARYTKKKP